MIASMVPSARKVMVMFVYRPSMLKVPFQVPNRGAQTWELKLEEKSTGLPLASKHSSLTMLYSSSKMVMV